MGHLVQAPCSGRIVPEYTAQDCVMMILEYIKWGRLHNLPGQPVPVLGFPHSKGVLFNHQLVHQLLLAVCSTIAWHYHEDLAPSSTPSFLSHFFFKKYFNGNKHIYLAHTSKCAIKLNEKVICTIVFWIFYNKERGK